MFVLRVSKAALAWKLTVLVVLVSGALSFVMNPQQPGSMGVLPTAAPAPDAVALVFDVPWGELEVPHILQVLAAHGTHATFEADPAWIQAYPDLARRIRRAGHPLVAKQQTADPDIPAMAPAGRGPSLKERARFVAEQALEMARPGGVIRLPADDLSPATAEALPLILERLRARQLSVGPLPGDGL